MRADIGMNESIRIGRVMSQTATPSNFFDFFRELFGGQPFESKVHGFAQAVLAVRSDISALFSKHFIEFPASITGNEFDASFVGIRGHFAQQFE